MAYNVYSLPDCRTVLYHPTSHGDGSPVKLLPAFLSKGEQRRLRLRRGTGGKIEPEKTIADPG